MPIELPPETVNTLKQLEREVADLQRELDRAEEAGIDVAPYRQQLEEAEALRKSLLRVYAPPRRSQ